MDYMSMLRFILIFGLATGVSGAFADDHVNSSAQANNSAPVSHSVFGVSVSPKVAQSVQQLRVDATASLPDEVKDPFEGFNRQIYRFNEVLDRRLLLPTAKLYQRVVPKPINTGITNFFQNISEPWTAVNQLLQGKPKASVQSLGRFTLNTLTSLGFADPANSSFDLKAEDEDFGQTLGVWGVKSGPYLMLPLFGPSTLRDATGKILDTAVSPTVYVDSDKTKIALTGTRVVDLRAALIGVESVVSGDQYPVLRDVYLQRRLFKVFDGAPPARLNPPVDEGFGDEEFDDDTSGTPADPSVSEGSSPQSNMTAPSSTEADASPADASPTATDPTSPSSDAKDGVPADSDAQP